jgi:tripartite-type tricarboxylate transporter receptor subunit TctC
VIVPYVPGGGTDFVGRTVAQKLADGLGSTVFVENRPGGGTNIGSELVARAPADGYTLLIGGVPNSANMALFQKMSYDTVKDFAPIVMLDTAPNILAVHPSVPAKSVKELIALAKVRRGLLTYASAGIGSSNHLSGELFRVMAGSR